MKFTVVQQKKPEIEWNNADSRYELTGDMEYEMKMGVLPIYLKDFAATHGWTPYRKQNEKTGLFETLFFFTREDSIVKNTLREETSGSIIFDKQMVEAIYNLKDDETIDVSDFEYGPNSFGYIPKGYQKVGVMNILKSMELTESYGYTRGHLLGDDMGLGKTAQVLMAITKKKDLRRILIICPTAVKFNWPRECRYWLSVDDSRFTRPDAHFPDERVFNQHKINILGGRNQSIGPAINIINYELVRVKSWFKKIKDVYWDLIVLDESHYIKNEKSATTKAILSLKKRHGICMTGTPLDKPSHLPSQLAFLCPNRFGDIGKIKNQYGYRSRLRSLRNVLDDMNMYTGRTKAEVAKDLPAMITKISPFEMPYEIKKELSNIVLNEHQLMEYADMVERKSREMENEIAMIPEDDHQAKLVAQRRFDRILQNMLAKAPEYKFPPEVHISELRQMIGVAKVGIAIDRAKEILQEPKQDNLVIFYNHRSVGDGLHKAFPDAIRIDGNDNAQSKDAKAKKFRERQSNIVLCSIRACNIGMTLLGTYALFAELDWNASSNSQAAARNHRIGQKFPCINEILVFADSIDSHIARIVSAKMSNIQTFAS